MAKKVTVSVLGGATKTYDTFDSIDEIKASLNLPSHTATLNGEAADDATSLADFSYVTLAPAVKGG